MSDHQLLLAIGVGLAQSFQLVAFRLVMGRVVEAKKTAHRGFKLSHFRRTTRPALEFSLRRFLGLDELSDQRVTLALKRASQRSARGWGDQHPLLRKRDKPKGTVWPIQRNSAERVRRSCHSTKPSSTVTKYLNWV